MLRHGITFPEDRFYSMGGMPSEQIIEILGAEQSVCVSPHQIAEQKELAFAALMDRLEPMHSIVSIAREYTGVLPMAVASGGIRPIVEQQLRQLGIDNLFQAQVTAEDTERHKPHPDVFIEAAKLLGVAPAHCLVFEDAPLGFAAARAAGMDFVDVKYPDEIQEAA